MLESDKLKLRQADLAKKLNGLLEVEKPTDDQAKEIREATKEIRALDDRIEAHITSEALARGAVDRKDGDLDAEGRELRELKGKARVADFLAAEIAGVPVNGASAEYRAAVKVPQGVPISLFELDAAPRREERADAATTVPASNTGVNLAPVMPAIFARAVLPRLGVSMPMVGSGAYSVPVITKSQSAGAVAKGAARESTAGTITAAATTPHRVSARLSIQVEDVASFGNDSFEAALRQNLMLALSDRLDLLGLTGDNTGANPNGLLTQLTDPDDPSAVVDFDGFIGLAAGGIDGGPWAENMMAVRVLVNAETMRLAEQTFRDKTAGTGNQGRGISAGEIAAASYLRENTGGFMASARMPATAAKIAAAIRFRSGTMGLDGVNAVMAATCPVWSYLAIDDIYSDSGSGTRHLTLHALIGDVIVNYADAYTRVDLKVRP